MTTTPETLPLHPSSVLGAYHAIQPYRRGKPLKDDLRVRWQPGAYEGPRVLITFAWDTTGYAYVGVRCASLPKFATPLALVEWLLVMLDTQPRTPGRDEAKIEIILRDTHKVLSRENP